MRGKTNIRKRRSVSRSDGVEEFKGYVLYSVLGIGSAIGSIFLIRHFVNKIAENKIQKKSLSEGDPSSYATQLYMAMGNEHWYTQSNNADILNILRSIPTKAMFGKVQDAYKINYKSNLSADLEKILSASDYITATMLISAKG